MFFTYSCQFINSCKGKIQQLSVIVFHLGYSKFFPLIFWLKFSIFNLTQVKLFASLMKYYSFAYLWSDSIAFRVFQKVHWYEKKRTGVWIRAKWTTLCCERLAHKSVVVTRLFFPVKKIALDLTSGVFGYIAKAIFCNI